VLLGGPKYCCGVLYFQLIFFAFILDCDLVWILIGRELFYFGLVGVEYFPSDVVVRDAFAEQRYRCHLHVVVGAAKEEMSFEAVGDEGFDVFGEDELAEAGLEEVAGVAVEVYYVEIQWILLLQRGDLASEDGYFL